MEIEFTFPSNKQLQYIVRNSPFQRGGGGGGAMTSSDLAIRVGIKYFFLEREGLD